MLILISFIGLVISFIIILGASGDDIRGKGSNTKLQKIAGIFLIVFAILFTYSLTQAAIKQGRQDEYTSVTISDKQGNLIHSYSGNIHYEGEDRLKIIDKEGNTIYYTIGDDEIFYGVH
jgi:phosphoglycerol transferase MdoB-like AlkP superfamily enzyme